MTRLRPGRPPARGRRPACQQSSIGSLSTAAAIAAAPRRSASTTRPLSRSKRRIRRVPSGTATWEMCGLPAGSSPACRLYLPACSRSSVRTGSAVRITSRSATSPSARFRSPAGRVRKTSTSVAPSRNAVSYGIGSIRPPSASRSPRKAGGSPHMNGTDALARAASISSSRSVKRWSTASEPVSRDVASALKSGPALKASHDSGLRLAITSPNIRSKSMIGRRRSARNG